MGIVEREHRLSGKKPDPRGRARRKSRRPVASTGTDKRSTSEEIISASHRRLDLHHLLEIVAGFAVSRPGKRYLQQLTPVTEVEMARCLMEETAEVGVRMKEGNWEMGLEGLADLTEILPETSAQVLDGKMLASIWQVIDRARRLKSLLERCPGKRLQGRSSKLVDIPRIRDQLERSIDSSGEILDTASEALIRLRSESAQIDAEIRKWFHDHADRSPWKKALQGNVITPRHGRLCWAIRAECKHQVKGVVRGESASGQTLFIEPEPVVRSGDRLQRSRASEDHEIQRILGELTREIRLRRDLILQLWQQLVELDGLQARARFAETLGCVVPELVDRREMVLKEARHPLLLWREMQPVAGVSPRLEDAYQRVIPMDLEMHPGRYQIVVTGPNTGGKTVVLKTVGLFSLMVCCGLPIPAGEGSSIPVFAGVLADIGDEQSLQQDLSTFSAHVTVVASILKRAGSRSLVLLDELGSGTDPLEGAPLAEAVLDRRYERGTFTLVTTHLGSLKEYAYRRRKCENASMEFDPQKLVPTYRVIVGLPGRSNALIIAERIGMPSDVVERARELSQDQDRIDSEVVDAMQRSQKDLERRSREADRHRREALRHREEMERKELEAQRVRGSLEYELERAQESKIIDTVQRIRKVLDRIGELPGSKKTVLQEAYRVLEESLSSTDLASRRLKTAATLSKGDAVFIPRFQQVCEVRKINKEKLRLVVEINGVATDIAFSEISWVLPPPGFHLWWQCSEGTGDEE